MLKNKTAFITGVNRGIGKSLLRKFASNGFNIFGTVRQKNEDIVNYTNELSDKFSIKVELIELDLKDEDNIKQSISDLYENKITLDVLINNAGIADGSIFEMTSMENLKKIFQVNFFSQIKITQLLLRFLKKSDSASIINIGSISGLVPEPGTLSYGSSKSALMFATRLMANEFSKYKIRANAIAPSIIDTDMMSQMDDKSLNTFKEQSFIKKIGTVEDVSNLALFLSSDEAKHINGQILRIDGGSKF